MNKARLDQLLLSFLLIITVAGCNSLGAEPELSTTAVSQSSMPTHAQLQAALRKVVAEQNGGFNLQMWATVMSRSGTVKAGTFSGSNVGDQWLGSRAPSPRHAN